MNRLSIIGLGWLGNQIGEYFMNRNYQIVGTVTSLEKATRLKNKGFEVSVLELEKLESIDSTSFDPFLSNVIFITIPPSANENYADKIIELIVKIQSANRMAKFIFTSSTSVYGNMAREIDESAATDPVSANAKVIVKVEEFLKKAVSDYLIIRLGGLVGRNRHPVNYLAGRVGIAKPQAPVNLIHANDICRAVYFLLEAGISNKIINVVTPDHPAKEDYYRTVAENLNLSLPNFDPQDNELGKVVTPKKLRDLGFKFNYQSPFQYPEAKTD
jgi:nucleoside-diphosphate-sugar epimerase